MRERHGREDGDPGTRAQPRRAHRDAAVRPARPRARPQAGHDRRQRTARAGRPVRRHPGRVAAGLRARDRSFQPGHRGRPRRLHPVRPVRARLRRHPGQRRHRAQRQGLRHPDRVRPERPDGELLLRLLRRVRRGLPDRRADQQADPHHPDPAAHRTGRGGHGLPVLRRRLRADLLRGPRAQRDLLRRGPGAARLARPAVREGPVRLGLRGLAAAADHAADPPRRLLPQGRAVRRRARRDDGRRPAGKAPPPQAGRPGRLRRGPAALPRGDLGRGPGPGGPQADRDPRGRRPGRDRRLRLGQVLQRGGLPLPEADQDRLPHQQRGSLHPAVPRLQRGRPVRGHRLRRGLHHLRRRDQRGRGHRHRQQLHGQPPGRVQLLQAGPPARHHDHLRGPAGRQDGRPRRHLLPAQAGHRRGLLQRHNARDHPAGPGRPRLHRHGARPAPA